MSKAQYLTAELPRTRCEPELKEAVAAIAAQSDRDMAFVIRKFVREGVAQAAVSVLAASVSSVPAPTGGKVFRGPDPRSK